MPQAASQAIPLQTQSTQPNVSNPLQANAQQTNRDQAMSVLQKCAPPRGWDTSTNDVTKTSIQFHSSRSKTCRSSLPPRNRSKYTLQFTHIHTDMNSPWYSICSFPSNLVATTDAIFTFCIAKPIHAWQKAWPGTSRHWKAWISPWAIHQQQLCIPQALINQSNNTQVIRKQQRDKQWHSQQWNTHIVTYIQTLSQSQRHCHIISHEYHGKKPLISSHYQSIQNKNCETSWNTQSHNNTKKTNCSNRNHTTQVKSIKIRTKHTQHTRPKKTFTRQSKVTRTAEEIFLPWKASHTQAWVEHERTCTHTQDRDVWEQSSTPELLPKPLPPQVQSHCACRHNHFRQPDQDDPKDRFACETK